jgi:hypothetical protein
LQKHPSLARNQNLPLVHHPGELIEAISKKSFGPISALGTEFKIAIGIGIEIGSGKVILITIFDSDFDPDPDFCPKLS